ncbi:sulfotransferase, partial [Pseudomonadota bacterium]
ISGDEVNFFRAGKKKVFVIGSNKTGTTSLGATLKKLGYRLGNQLEAELLIDDWARRNFKRLIKYCHTADAFQDIPFSLDYTFQAMDAAFPGSRFILSVRDNADTWYQSLIRFHSTRRGHNRLPTADELKADPYVWPGYQWYASRLVYGIDEGSVWNEEIYKRFYLQHIETVQTYFKYRRNDLLVINLSEVDAMQKLCEFLEMPILKEAIPKLNASG